MPDRVANRMISWGDLPPFSPSPPELNIYALSPAEWEAELQKCVAELEVIRSGWGAVDPWTGESNGESRKALLNVRIELLRREIAYRRAPETPGTPGATGKAKRTSTEIIYYGDLNYGTDVAEPVTVSERDHDVLQAFLVCGQMDLKKLKRQSGFDSALASSVG